MHRAAHPVRRRRVRHGAGHAPGRRAATRRPRLVDAGRLASGPASRSTARRPGSRARASRAGGSCGTAAGLAVASTSASSTGDPARDRQPDAVVDVPVGQDRVRFPVVAAQRDPLGAVPEHGRDQVGEVLAGRALPDEDPHALAALLLRLVERACTRGRTRRRRPGRRRAPRPRQARRVPVDPAVAGGRDLRQQLGVARHHAGEVHHLGHADRTVLVEQPGDLGGVHLRARALERRRRHAARRADPEGKRQPGRGLGPARRRRGTPKTLASSCGSAATAVVPCGRTARTNSSTQSLVDSRCMCASMKPGVSAAPATSTTSRASRGPQPAITPSAMARSSRSHSLVPGEKTLPAA